MPEKQATLIDAHILPNSVDLSTALHSHDFHQFLYLFGGHASIMLRDTRFTLRAHHMLMLRPHVMHAFAFPRPSQVRMNVFEMKCRLPEAIVGTFCGPEVIQCSAQRAVIEPLCSLIAGIIDDSILASTSAANGAIRCLSAILARAPAGAVMKGRSRINARIRAVLAHINEHPAGDHSLDSLAAVASLNKSYFVRLFKSTVGMTPARYLLVKRMDEAKRRLSLTADTIASIAREAGFSHYHNFSDQFKRIYGVRPTVFRKRSVRS